MASEPSPAADEPDLLERLRAGEEGAYEELVRRYGGRLLAVARRFLPVEEDARDAVQDAFLSAFRSIDRFEGHAQLSTWLHRIVVNASLMKLRTRRRKPEQSIEELLPGYPRGRPPRAPGVALAHRRARPGRAGTSCASSCCGASTRCRRATVTCCCLRDIEDLDTEEAAELLEISPGAVKTRLHRARQALRELLEPHLREATPS